MNTIFKTNRVKAITVSMRLRSFLFTLINTNKFSGTVAGKMVGELTLNLAYPCII